MIKYLSILLLISGASSYAQKSIIQDNVTIDVYTYEYENKMKAAAMPELRAESECMKHKRRFEYLLINVPEIHLPGKAGERKKMFDLYPDTLAMKRLYLKKLMNDKKLAEYFEQTMASVTNPNLKANKTYTANELMEVASKFFYCDKVNSDTSIQSHVCIGINGLSETRWEKDYTLLSAFCFEAIFNDFDQDTSQISASYDAEKKISCEQFRKNITTLDAYLKEVKLDLFNRMKNNFTLKKELMDYYELNKNNLAFTIIE